MKSIGTQFREAREARGETLSEAARLTRIKMQQLEGMERDDFSLVPAPTYIKGFIRLYARHLDLDAEALVDGYFSAQAQETVEPAPRVSSKVLHLGRPVSDPMVPEPASPGPDAVVPPGTPSPSSPMAAPVLPAAVSEASAEEDAPRGSLVSPPNIRTVPLWSLQGPWWIKVVVGFVGLLLLVLVGRGCAGSDGPAEDPDLRPAPPVLPPLTDEPVIIERPADPLQVRSAGGST